MNIHMMKIIKLNKRYRRRDIQIFLSANVLIDTFKHECFVSQAIF